MAQIRNFFLGDVVASNEQPVERSILPDRFGSISDAVPYGVINIGPAVSQPAEPLAETELPGSAQDSV